MKTFPVNNGVLVLLLHVALGKRLFTENHRAADDHRRLEDVSSPNTIDTCADYGCDPTCTDSFACDPECAVEGGSADFLILGNHTCLCQDRGTVDSAFYCEEVCEYCDDDGICVFLSFTEFFYDTVDPENMTQVLFLGGARQCVTNTENSVRDGSVCIEYDDVETDDISCQVTATGYDCACVVAKCSDGVTDGAQFTCTSTDDEQPDIQDMDCDDIVWAFDEGSIFSLYNDERPWVAAWYGGGPIPDCIPRDLTQQVTFPPVPAPPMMDVTVSTSPTVEQSTAPAAMAPGPSDPPAQAPTVIGGPGEFESCAICGEGLEVTLPDATIFNPIDQTMPTCGEIDEGGKMGQIPPGFCSQLPNVVSDLCGCMAVMTPVAPSVAPPTPPFPVSPTDAPTDETSSAVDCAFGMFAMLGLMMVGLIVPLWLP